MPPIQPATAVAWHTTGTAVLDVPRDRSRRTLPSPQAGSPRSRRLPIKLKGPPPVPRTSGGPWYHLYLAAQRGPRGAVAGAPAGKTRATRGRPSGVGAAERLQPLPLRL